MRLPLAAVLGLILVGCQVTKPTDLHVAGVSEPVILLNGTWRIHLNPPEEFWKLTDLNDEWKEIQVPGECMMQGFPIKHDAPFAYKCEIQIPTDYRNKTVKLQFEGVYSYARVWINGNYMGDHSGGFTRWACDITAFVTPGETAMLTVEVTDKADEISYASGYAKHPIGGILRDVTLLALPQNYPEELSIETDLDEDFKDATLIVSGRTNGISENSKLKIELINSVGERIGLENYSVSLNNQDFVLENYIVNPLKWDAEHPNLYRLEVSYLDNDELVWMKAYRIGFREITVEGNKLLVNGNEVKLRGANRHDIHPLLGRVSTPEYERKDVLLAREANINFIRTSHYPPTDHFLSLCDEYGLYVEDETAVCFVGTHRMKEFRPGATENDPVYTDRYLSQLIEMVTFHKKHPSVILWSVGNENQFGANFKKSYDWVKIHDSTRPVIFSYPGLVPDTVQAYDILSMHYPDFSGDLTQYGKATKGFSYSPMPVLFDEWAHVACYNNLTLTEDPNIRNFWGVSLDSMWHKTFVADGGLGGAIWCMIDETFMIPDSLPGFNDWWGIIDDNVTPAAYAGKTVGYGEWGNVDTWRRKKPEFWNTKKAYTPVKVLKTEFDRNPKEGPLMVPLFNRFDHTDISVLTVRMEYRGEGEVLVSPQIKPHSKGELTVPVNAWECGEPIVLEFIDSKGRLIDKYTLTQKTGSAEAMLHQAAEDIRIEETEATIEVICENETRVVLDRSTGLIREVVKPSGAYSLRGPVLNLRTRGSDIMDSYHEINE